MAQVLHDLSAVQWKLWKISETNCSCVGKLSQCFCCLQTKTVRSLNSKCHHSDQPHWRPFHCFVLASLVPLQPWPVCLIQIWVGKEKTFLALLGPAGTSTQANKQVGGTLLPLKGGSNFLQKEGKTTEGAFRCWCKQSAVDTSCLPIDYQHHRAF